jgi:hypothetical protein
MTVVFGDPPFSSCGSHWLGSMVLHTAYVGRPVRLTLAHSFSTTISYEPLSLPQCTTLVLALIPAHSSICSPSRLYGTPSDTWFCLRLISLAPIASSSSPNHSGTPTVGSLTPGLRRPRNFGSCAITSTNLGAFFRPSDSSNPLEPRASPFTADRTHHRETKAASIAAGVLAKRPRRHCAVLALGATTVPGTLSPVRS